MNRRLTPGLEAEKAKWIAVARTPYEEKVAEIVFEKIHFEPKGPPESRVFRHGFEPTLHRVDEPVSKETLQDLCKHLNNEKRFDNLHFVFNGEPDDSEKDPEPVNTAPEPKKKFVLADYTLLIYAGLFLIFLALLLYDNFHMP